MIRICLILMATWLLSACTVYQSIGDSFGTYVSAPDGQDFQPVAYRWDYEHTALLYVYRPQSQWSDDELESPSFYMNDERLFNLKGSAYTWYELKPGNHSLIIRRPLLGLEGLAVTDFFDFTLKQVAQMELFAKAGEVYYLRYSELEPLELGPTEEVITVSDGPLQLVPASLALAEIKETKMLHKGRGLVASAPVVKEVEVEESNDSEALFGIEEEAEKTSVSPVPKQGSNKEQDWSPF